MTPTYLIDASVRRGTRQLPDPGDTLHVCHERFALQRPMQGHVEPIRGQRQAWQDQNGGNHGQTAPSNVGAYHEK